MQATQTIPPGLAATELEFYFDKAHQELFALYEGVKYPFNELPTSGLQLLHRSYIADEEARKALEATGQSIQEQLYQYAKCRFGGFSFDPDLTDSEENSECWNCECSHGECATMHIFRAQHPAPHGYLTTREIQVVKELGSCQIGYVIASELSITEDTLNQHKSRIFKKVGVQSTSALLLWAQKQDLL